MAVPSNPGWKFGYVPSPGEWNNTFAGKVDYPAPLSQGGTGGQDAPSGNYNLQQRAEVITPAQAAAALTFYSVRTDLSATTITLPLANSCRAGDWIDVFDSGANASVNNITIAAAEADVISRNATAAGSLLLRKNGVRCILVTDGVGTWRAQAVSQSTGIGLAASSVRPITATTVIDQSYIGSLCKLTGAGIVITLPTTGFINGNTVAFVNADPTNVVNFTAGAGNFPLTLRPNDCCIVVADGAGGWWRASSVGSGTASSPAPIQVTGTAYVLQTSDAGQYLQFTAATAVTVTVPTNATVPFAPGSVIVMEQYGAGQITLVNSAGVVLNGRSGLKSGGQFAVMQIKNGSNGSNDTWTVLGDTAA